VFFSNCTFLSNAAVVQGGVAYSVLSSELYFINCTFDNNTAIYGSAISSTATSLIFLADTVFRNSRVTVINLVISAGILHLSNGALATLVNCHVDLVSPIKGAVIPFLYVVDSASLNVTRSTFVVSSAQHPHQLPVLQLNDGKSQFFNCVFININTQPGVFYNSLDYSGAAADLTLKNCSFVSCNDIFSMATGSVTVYQTSFQNSNWIVSSGPDRFIVPLSLSFIECILNTTSLFESRFTNITVRSSTIIAPSLTSLVEPLEAVFVYLTDCYLNIFDSVVLIIPGGLIRLDGGSMQLSNSTLKPSVTTVSGYIINATASHISIADSIVSGAAVVAMATVSRMETTVFNNSQLEINSSLVAISQNVFTNSIIVAGDSFLSLSDTLFTDVENVSITLISSNMTIFNSAVATTEFLDWVECSSSSYIMGDLQEWHISPECQTQYQAMTLDDRTSDVTFILSGNQEIVELVLSKQDAGVNITLSLEKVSGVGSPIDPNAINVYLVPVSCTKDFLVDINSNYLYSTIGQELYGHIGFDGPSPLFMKPDSSGTTTYCLIINSTTALKDGVFLFASANFIKRTLTTSQVQLDPSILLYTRLVSVGYNLLDQWGHPYFSLKALEITSPDCNYQLCGNTIANSSTGEVYVRFNATITWQIHKQVAVNFPNAPPTFAHRNFFCSTDRLVS